jgi:predicted DNA-binding protein
MALVHTRAMLKRTTIWLTREQGKRLQAVAKRKGLKAAQLIRLYVDAGLSKEKN